MGFARDFFRKWWIPIVILLLAIPASVMLFQSTQQQPKITKINKQISEIRQEQHPSLYFVDLEYDPNTQKAIKKSSGYFNGDLTPLKSEISFLPEVFNYRVEAVSKTNEALVSGWESLYKNVILTEDGKYSFRVSVPYIEGETIRIYSIGYQKLWEEKVK